MDTSDSSHSVSETITQVGERSRGYSRYADALRNVLDSPLLDQLERATELIERTFRSGNTIFVAGNGGSAATASHMVADFQKTTLGKQIGNSKRIRALALTDNTPLITAWGNDFGYELIFAEQLRALANAGDLLLVITASGNSPNILSALEAARDLGLQTIGFLGFEGGRARALCEIPLVVSSSNYGIIEDSHSIFMHMMTESLKETILRLQH